MVIDAFLGLLRRQQNLGVVDHVFVIPATTTFEWTINNYQDNMYTSNAVAVLNSVPLEGMTQHMVQEFRCFILWKLLPNTRPPPRPGQTCDIVGCTTVSGPQQPCAVCDRWSNTCHGVSRKIQHPGHVAREVAWFNQPFQHPPMEERMMHQMSELIHCFQSLIFDKDAETMQTQFDEELTISCR